MTVTRNRTCTGKTPHPTRNDAIHAATERQRNYGATRNATNVYKCPYGDHWHVGHKPRPRS